MLVTSLFWWVFLGWIAFLSPIPPATYEVSHPPKPQFFTDARGSVVDTAVNYTYFYRENFACEADNECVSSVSFSESLLSECRVIRHKQKGFI